MLTMVCVEKRKRRRLVQWIREGFRKPDSIDSAFSAAGSGRYLRITAFQDKQGQIDWAAVRTAAGREAGRLLLPGELHPPQDSGVGLFRSEGILQRLLMQSTALWLLRQGTGEPKDAPRRLTAAVFDPDGNMPDLPVSLVPYAADVRVVTRRPEAYRYAQTLSMEEYGASIAVTGDGEALSGARLILTLQPLGDIRPAGKRLILAAQPEEALLEEGVIGHFLADAPDLLEGLPEGIDPGRFLSGLYELSGVRDMAAPLPAACRVDGRQRPLKDLLQRLPGLDITGTV